MTEENAFERKSPFNYLKCKSCAFRTKSLGVILSHVKKHQVDLKSTLLSCSAANLEAFECEFCYFETDLKIALDRHESMVHRGRCPDPKIKVNSYLCDKCNFESYSLLVFARHVCDYSQLESENNFSQFEVPSCKSESNPDRRKYDFEEYFKQDGVRWFKCQQCSHETKRMQNLKNHILAKHTEMEEAKCFECEKCVFKAKFRYQLREHILAKHANEDEWFKCEQCSFKSIRQSTLKRHILRIHSDNMECHKCKHCSFKTKYKYNFEKHMLIHTDPEHVTWFKCEQCSYKSIRQSDLKRHILTIHSDNAECYKCKHCSFTTRFKNTFKKHMSIYPEHVTLLKCEQCFYKSKYKSHLKKHILSKHTKVQMK